MSGHATNSAALTNINLSSLFGSATPSATSDTPDIPSSNTTPSMQAVASVTSTTETSPTVAATHANDEAGTPLSIGAIVGIVVGAVAGLLALVCVLLVWRRRGRAEPKKFDRGRGITPSMVLQPPMASTFAQHNLADLPHYLYPDKVDHHDDEQRPTSHTTAALDQMYKIKQYNTSDTSTPATILSPPPVQINTPPPSSPSAAKSARVVSQGARLSKYNYLAEAFTQMRASHITQPASSSEELHRYNAHPNYYDPYSQEDQQLAGTPPPPVAKNNTGLSPAFMEPAPPAATASPPSPPSPPPPQQRQSSQSSLVPRITIYNENDEELPPVTGLSPPQSSPLYDHLQKHRFSLSSEVSQYSTPSNPFRFDTTPTKRYDYF